MHVIIWEVRTDKKITLQELSRMTGISKGALSNYENGIRYPRIDQLEKIAKSLKVKIGDLYESSYK